MTTQFQTINIDYSQHPWLAIIMGGYGILTRCISELHDPNFVKSYLISFRFAQKVLNSLLSRHIPDEDLNAFIMDEAIDCIGKNKAGLLATIWFTRGKEHVFLSCGTNTLFMVENGKTTKLIAPHSLSAILKVKNGLILGQEADLISTHLLGTNCKACELNSIIVRKSSNAALVLIADPRVAKEFHSAKVEITDIEKHLQTITSQITSDNTHCIFYINR